MAALVGYTGFVGSNIMEQGKIDAAFNSKNIEGLWFRAGCFNLCRTSGRKISGKSES